MQNDIKVEGFDIICYGDSSVGIPDAHWTLEKEFYFDDETHINEFKEKLREAFEVVCADPVQINTYRELEEERRQEDRMWNLITLTREEYNELKRAKAYLDEFIREADENIKSYE